jgi:hypothetical protein
VCPGASGDYFFLAAAFFLAAGFLAAFFAAGFFAAAFFFAAGFFAAAFFFAAGFFAAAFFVAAGFFAAAFFFAAGFFAAAFFFAAGFFFTLVAAIGYLRLLFGSGINIAFHSHVIAHLKKNACAISVNLRETRNQPITASSADAIRNAHAHAVPLPKNNFSRSAWRPINANPAMLFPRGGQSRGWLAATPQGCA